MGNTIGAQPKPEADRLKKRLLLHGVWHDAVMFSFVRDDGAG